MNKLSKTAAILALSTLALASCAQPSQQTASNSANQAQNSENQTANTANPAGKNLCELLKISEVSALAGVTFTKSEHKIDNSENPAITDCFYSNEDGLSVAIIANYDSGSRTAKKSYQELTAYQAKQEKNFPSEKVTGVGEEAFIMNASIITQINALNKNVWLTLSIYTKDKAGQKDKAIAIAKRAFEVL